MMGYERGVLVILHDGHEHVAVSGCNDDDLERAAVSLLARAALRLGHGFGPGQVAVATEEIAARMARRAGEMITEELKA